MQELFLYLKKLEVIKIKKKLTNLIEISSFQVITITGMSFLLSVLGFINNLILARVFGIGAEIDLFLYVTSTPLFIAALLNSYFMYGVVPLLIKVTDLKRSSTDMLILACLLSCPFFFIALILKIDVLYISSSLFNIYGLKANMILIAWTIGGVQIIFGAISAILNVKKNYFTSILLQALTPIGLLVGTVIATFHANIIYPLIGMLMGLVVATISGIFFLRNFWIKNKKNELNNVKYLFDINLKTFNTLVATSAFAVFSIIDAHLAISHGDGVLSTLGYAQRIIIGFGNLAVIGVFTIAGPKFAETLQNDGFFEFKLIVKKALSTVLSIAVGLGLILWLNLEILLKLIFGERANTDEVNYLLSILPIMLIGMIPMLCSSVLLRAVFCIRNINIYIILFGVGVPVIYMALCLLLSSMGLFSFAISYLTSWIYGLIVLLIPLFIRQNRYNVEDNKIINKK